MNASQARQERARLEGEEQNAVAAGGRARNGKTAFARDRGKLTHDLEVERVQLVREDKPTSERAEELMTALSALPTDAECDSVIDRADRARRDARTELDYLLKDHLDVFAADAAVLSEAACGQFQALVVPIAEALAAAQAARLSWAKLSPALGETLRERDEARGTYSPSGVYQRLTAFPQFPIAVGDANWSARPAGVAKLPKQTKRAA